MSDENARIQRERQMITEARQEGPAAKLWVYTRLSGPGWLQSAITLGGGSLAGSLYLGVLAGYRVMWWQPLAMIMGVIMLSAIGYVTLSTGERPFAAINKHVNPVLGWGWAIATMMANLVWCMPQYSLGTAAVRQNLLPHLFGETVMDKQTGEWTVVALLFLITGIVIWFYDSGGWGVRLFEWLLKIMVAVVVVSFFAVVIKMSLSADGLPWNEIAAGFIPDFSRLWNPADDYGPLLAEVGRFSDFWTEQIVDSQQKVMITAAATAVGINMTFLLPYSMLRKGWDREFRGLAIFDLSTGLFIPFMLATGCVVIASASQFHANEAPGLVEQTRTPAASENAAQVRSKSYDSSRGAVPETDRPDKQLVDRYHTLLDARLARERGAEQVEAMSADELAAARGQLPLSDRRLAAMIVKRDAFDLARALRRLTGEETTGQYLFGIGVVGMAISTIIILMLINGFVLTEITGQPENRSLHRAGCFMASIVGAVGFKTLWATGAAQFWLAVPTSMFGMVLLPIAYITFFMMMNSKSLMGENILTGGKRVRWNVLMALAAAFATFCCLWSVWRSGHPVFGFSVLGAFVLLAVVVQIARGKPDLVD